ncbi:hypothetical protein BB560_003374, partial [Smittium megazygosporum]
NKMKLFSALKSNIIQSKKGKAKDLDAIHGFGGLVLIDQPEKSILSQNAAEESIVTKESCDSAPTTDEQTLRFQDQNLVKSASQTPNIVRSKSDAVGEYDKQINVDALIFRLLETGFSGKYSKSFCLKNSEISMICSAASELFLSQPMLLHLNGPLKIAGDIHGQYFDLLRLFDKCGYPPQTNYLFLGDYVDRGRQSLETIMLLLCYKLKYPNNFFLLRGNHETSSISKVYGFYDECKRRSNVKIWKTVVDTFNVMPVAALVLDKIFCVHGGLSPELDSFEQIQSIQRPVEVESQGLLNDLLWSDPSSSEVDWGDSDRGVSFCFGESVVEQFVKKMGIDMICRAHMVVEDGYEFFAKRKLVTVFSAPNYCGEFDNSGGIMTVSDDLLCSFEILKPLIDNVLLTLSRIESNFWNRLRKNQPKSNPKSDDTGLELRRFKTIA